MVAFFFCSTDTTSIFAPMFIFSSASFLLPFLLVTLLASFEPAVAGTSPGFSEFALTQKNVERFVNAGRGSYIAGLSKFKKYFHRFGYLPLEFGKRFSDHFDARFEFAITLFQMKHGMLATGKLDLRTLSEIGAPRCGVADTLHWRKDYVYFPGRPRWNRRSPMKLTYAFSLENQIEYLSSSEIEIAFKRAFQRWEEVIPVSFAKSEDYGFADIRIGFYGGDHGDGEPFDGVLGVLAHSFSPESGRLHLDAAERWAVDFRKERSKVAVDLESVVAHEIGHLLGLGHSSVKEAVMYPSLRPREKKVDLHVDDIIGVQSLYGSNRNFTFASVLESNSSTNRAVDPMISSVYKWANLALTIFWAFQ